VVETTEVDCFAANVDAAAAAASADIVHRRKIASRGLLILLWLLLRP
jgi:hypothetical protein